MVRRFAFLLTLLLPLAGAAAAQTQARELAFGVAPYISPTNLVEQYAPLKEHLAKAIGRSLALTSAPDFRSFVDRTRAGDYDIIFVPPHMARLAQQRDGMRMLAQTGHSVEVIVFSRRDGGIRTLDDLRGRSLATAFRTSMVHQVVDATLRERKILLGTDVRLVDTLSHSNVPEAVARGDADAGATGVALWETLPIELRKNLLEIYHSPSFPGFFLLAHPRIGNPVVDRLRKAALEFPATPAGAAFFKRSRMVDFRTVDEQAMRRLEPFARVFERSN